jgi:hypothetical protein
MNGCMPQSCEYYKAYRRAKDLKPNNFASYSKSFPSSAPYIFERDVESYSIVLLALMMGLDAYIYRLANVSDIDRTDPNIMVGLVEEKSGVSLVLLAALMWWWY